ncbi:hypothetical protein HMI54_000516 [Coelomomyces lativittatus]|nr:hypothetical protein HMI56_002978 [Coelomomyces lativittatus]KAJ1511785.1 hypothetical protein HMI54_000516 [Coelomomyces lativittatus]
MEPKVHLISNTVSSSSYLLPSSSTTTEITSTTNDPSFTSSPLLTLTSPPPTATCSLPISWISSWSSTSAMTTRTQSHHTTLNEPTGRSLPSSSSSSWSSTYHASRTMFIEYAMQWTCYHELNMITCCSAIHLLDRWMELEEGGPHENETMTMVSVGGSCGTSLTTKKGTLTQPKDEEGWMEEPKTNPPHHDCFHHYFPYLMTCLFITTKLYESNRWFHTHRSWPIRDLAHLEAKLMHQLKFRIHAFPPSSYALDSGSVDSDSHSDFDSDTEVVTEPWSSKGDDAQGSDENHLFQENTGRIPRRMVRSTTDEEKTRRRRRRRRGGERRDDLDERIMYFTEYLMVVMMMMRKIRMKEDAHASTSTGSSSFIHHLLHQCFIKKKIDPCVKQMYGWSQHVAHQSPWIHQLYQSKLKKNIAGWFEQWVESTT